MTRRLRVGAVEDGDRPRPRSRPRSGGRRSATRPCAPRSCSSSHSTMCTISPEPRSDQSRFSCAVGVVADDRVRGVEDALGRAVVLLEADRLRVREVASRSRACCGCRRRATSRSTGPSRRPRRRCRATRPARAPGGTARGWCPGTRRPSRAGTSAATSRGRRARPRAAARRGRGGRRSPSRRPAEAPLVAGVHVGDGLVEEARHLGRELLGPDQPVLGVGDAGVDAARRVALRILVELVLEHVLDDPDLVGLVVDREAGPEPDAVGLGAAGCARRRRGTSSPTCRGCGRRAGRRRAPASPSRPGW